MTLKLHKDKSTKKEPKHIVIIGANFAGLSAASKLSKTLCTTSNEHYNVTVIDKRDQFQWTPNIHEILSDVKKDTNLSLDLKTVLSRLNFNFLHGSVSDIEAETQTITLQDKQRLNYDVLLIASGHERENYGISGADKYAHSIRTAKDAIEIHNELEILLSSSRPTVTINIVGGGFSGVEVMGEILRKHADKSQLQINIIETGPRLLAALPEKLSEDVLKQCENCQVDFLFNKQIKELSQNSLTFDDDSELTSDLCIWTAGTKLPDFLKGFTASTKTDGIVVSDDLQCREYSNVFVAGDSAELNSKVAKQASHAIDMGIHAGRNIARFCMQENLRPFVVRKKPVLLSLGDINTYFIQGNLVLASPLLASAKELVYQFWMARLSSLLPVVDGVSSIGNRLALSSEKLLLAEIVKMRPRILIGRSKLL